jgi:hypothetical protein
MPILPSLKSEIVYARDIVKAGLDAAASAGKPRHLGRASQSALAPAVLGIGVGVLGVYLGRKGRDANVAVLGGLLGGALGFTSGLAWCARSHARNCCVEAAHSVQAVRDAHWLEKNPIAYA